MLVFLFCGGFGKNSIVGDMYLTQEKLFSRKRTIRVTNRSQNIENSWAFLSFKVDMTFTLNDNDLQMTLTFK